MGHSVKLLLRKSLRDIRQNWVSFLACILMLALASTLFIAFSAAFTNLRSSCEVSYQRLRFQDFSVELRRPAPAAAVGRIERITGVRAAVGRRKAKLQLVLPPGSRRTMMDATAHEIPFDRRPAVNDLHVEQGRYLGSARGEALLEKRFADFYGYKVGDVMNVEQQGHRFRFVIVGLVSSPEYVWYVRSRFDPRPAVRRWCVFFVSQQDILTLAPAEVEEIQVTVEDPAKAREIAQAAQARLTEYLPYPPTMRAEQPSHKLVLRDQRAFAGLAVLFPAVFFFLSAAILFTSLWQLVAQQRRQIGILMVNGFSDQQLLIQYLFSTCVVGLTGSLVGLPAGYFLSIKATEFYSRTLGLPFLSVLAPWVPSLIALIASLGVALFSGWMATRHLLGMPASSCLRPAVATYSRKPFFERWLPALKRLSYLFRLPVRNLLRQPVRSLVSVLGIAFAVAQILMVLAIFDSQRSTLRFFFEKVHLYDLRVELWTDNPRDNLPPIERWQGVRRVERSFRAWASFSSQTGHLQKSVWGLEKDSRLYRLYDQERHPIALPEGEKILMGPIPKRRLHLQSGEPVEMMLETDHNPEAPILTYQADPRLLEVIEGPMVMNLRQLQKQHIATGAWGNPDAVNQLFLTVDPDKLDEISRRLQEHPQVREVVSLSSMRQEINDLFSLLGAFKWVMFLFSGLLAFALLTGTTTMNVMERSGELATMAVLGVRERTLAGLLMVEVLLLWLAGLVVGIPAGYVLGNWLLNNYQSDLIQMTMGLELSSCYVTAAVSLGICLMAAMNSLSSVLKIPLKEAMLDRTH